MKAKERHDFHDKAKWRRGCFTTHRQGGKQEKIGIAKNFKKSGIPLDVIAKNTGLREEEVAEL